MTDEKLETWISAVLRFGVLASALIVAVAGVWYLAQYHAHPVPYDKFVMERSDLRDLDGIIHSAFHGQIDAIIQLGLLLLIATPITRVALAGVGFFLERDYLYVVVSTLVLAILIYSLIHPA